MRSKKVTRKSRKVQKGKLVGKRENYVLTLKAKTRVKKEQKTKLYTNIKGNRQNDKLQ